MSGYPGYYSLIQYCPDLSRAEAANVGVLLFCPALRFLDARTAQGNDRVRRFFGPGSLDLGRINVMKRSIARRLRADAESFQSVDDLRRFIETRGNDIVLTALRPVKVEDAQSELDRLFHELVGGRVAADRARQRLPELERELRPLIEDGRVQRNSRVTVPVLGTTIKAAYVYRNGIVNLIKPQAFPADDEGIKRRAGQLAIQGDLLWKHPTEGEQHRLVVVSASPLERAGETDEKAVMPLFAEYNVKFVPRSEVASFAQEVRRSAH
jgi:hypothetical protein